MVAAVKVLIVDDDAKLARLLRRALSEEGHAADVCGTGADALSQAATGVYDLIVLDWMLPDLDGLAVCRELRRQGRTVPILMLTARGEVKERVLGLRSGADDYLGKPFELEELLARIQALLRRAAGHVPLTLGPLAIDRLKHRALVAGRPLDLTPREFALLAHLAERGAEVVPRSELLAHVWGTSFDPGSNLVDVHVSRLRDKLGEHAWMVDTVRGKGYRLRGEPDK
jgi:DNA-binding response OmpR family regulator